MMGHRPVKWIFRLDIDVDLLNIRTGGTSVYGSERVKKRVRKFTIAMLRLQRVQTANIYVILYIPVSYIPNTRSYLLMIK